MWGSTLSRAKKCRQNPFLLDSNTTEGTIFRSCGQIPLKLSTVLPDADDGVILAVSTKQEEAITMKVVCSWCRGEGQDGFVAEKAPFEDLRETHSICLAHETVVRARWEARRRKADASSLYHGFIWDLGCCTGWLLRSIIQAGAGSLIELASMGRS